MKLFFVTIFLCSFASISLIKANDSNEQDVKVRQKRLAGAGVLVLNDNNDQEQQFSTSKVENLSENELYWKCVNDRKCPDAKELISRMSSTELIEAYKEKKLDITRAPLTKEQFHDIEKFRASEIEKKMEEKIDNIKGKISKFGDKFKNNKN